MTRTLDLGVIAGDGIGPEVTTEALRVLRAAVGDAVVITQTDYALGATHYRETGEVLTDENLEALAGHDAILLGAVGGDPRDPRLAGGLIERGLLLRLRFAFDHHVNLRPTRILPGVSSPLAAPGEVDFVVVREGTEGPYVGNGGALRVGTPHEIANELSVNTAYGIERVVRFAFAQAAARRHKLTLVHKTNVLVHSGGLWQRIVTAVAAEHPDVNVDYLHVDAATPDALHRNRGGSPDGERRTGAFRCSNGSLLGDRIQCAAVVDAHEVAHGRPRAFGVFGDRGPAAFEDRDRIGTDGNGKTDERNGERNDADPSPPRPMTPGPRDRWTSHGAMLRTDPER